MKNIKTRDQMFEKLGDEYDVTIPLEALARGINNDHSIQRYTTQYKDVMKSIGTLMKMYGKDLPDHLDAKEAKGVQFEDHMVKDAAAAIEKQIKEGGAPANLKKLAEAKDAIERFGKELNINMDTLRDKYDEKFGRKMPQKKEPEKEDYSDY